MGGGRGGGAQAASARAPATKARAEPAATRPAPESPDAVCDGAVPDAVFEPEVDCEVWDADDIDDDIDEAMLDTLLALDEAADEIDDAALDAEDEVAEPVDDSMMEVVDGADCELVAEPDEARPEDELTPRHESSPGWMVTGAVAAWAPVESVRVRVISVPAAMLTVQVNDVSDVGCSSRVARTGPESEPPGTTRT